MQDSPPATQTLDHGHEHAVACNGGGVLGHPKVYLSLKEGRAVCPYCGKVLTETTDAEAKA
ncbi:MAG: zinc-finger domain-containing protein [Rhodospirillaceae bacterium]|nr:zinc-finger domain-containing protein [Rhodospirillaceae bacterium]